MEKTKTQLDEAVVQKTPAKDTLTMAEIDAKIDAYKHLLEYATGARINKVRTSASL